MADKKSEPKIVVERTYNVPLRSGWLKVPKYKRSKKAVTVLKEFLSKHMKSDDVKLGMYLNEHIWQDGIKNPPHHVKIHVTKDEEGVVMAELEGHEFKGAIKAKPKVEKATGLKGKLQSALDTGKDEGKEEKKEAKVEEKKTKAEKPEAKKEATPVKKEAKVEEKKTETKTDDKKTN